MKYKTYLFLSLFLFLFISTSNIFGQSYWMQRAGGLTPDAGSDISTDAAGNTYTTGYFTSTAAFGSFSLSSAGVTDIFITKLNSQGIYQWAVSAGGAGSDRGLSIKADAAGNSYITGYFYGTATFGGQTVTSAGIQDVFIAKYNTAGVLQWVKSAGGSNSDIGNGINVDNAGNVFVTGEFSGTATFGSFTLTSLNNSIDVFTTKLDANGNFLWAKKGSGTFTDRGLDIACDAAGNAYVTGQFTDTITFDVPHYNTQYNAIFIVKYNSAGQEQWFRMIGGGSMNIAYGIAADANSNVYLTGDFTGNLIFFGPPNVTLTNPHINKIFVAKYDNAGNLLWTHADGSDNFITSKNITVDASGNPYIVGDFKCKFDDYAAQYGQGTFNSVGFLDIYATGYNTSGVWQWSRQCGGKQDDDGAGIAVNTTGNVTITGSFNKTLMFPSASNFIGYNYFDIYGGGTYCNTSNYYYYHGFNSAGNTDIFIAQNFDITQPTYDYYARNGAGCNRPYVGVCINNTTAFLNCPDTVTFCNVGSIDAVSNTYPMGPDFTYLWNTNATSSSLAIHSTGYYSVTQTTVDGCFQSTDSIYVVVNPDPSMPTINGVINLPTIHLCNDSVLLTGGNIATGDTYSWTSPTGATSPTLSTEATVSGNYDFTVTNSFGCSITNGVYVMIDTAIHPMIPEITCLEDTDHNDSITLCTGSPFTMLVYDSITNPFGNNICLPNASIHWTASPGTISYIPVPSSGCPNTFTPSQSGTYQINAMIIRHNNCNADTTYINQSIYVNLLPLPVVSTHVTIIGRHIICPGSTNLLIASGTPFTWSGNGVSGLTQDSVYITQPGGYSVSSHLTVTDADGCTATSNASASINVVYPPQPVVTINSATSVICPGDSLQLVSTGNGTFQWQGPTGPIGGSNSTVFVNTPGNYYSILTDTSGCVLVSNTVLVNQYNTPYLLAGSSPVLCPGDSMTINVISNAGSSVQWQPPLLGNSSSQVVHSAGTYSCIISSCGIQTMATVTVTMSNISAHVNLSGPSHFCSGDSVVLSAIGGFASYNWQPGNFNQPSITGTQTGNYTLIVTDANGCIDSSHIAIYQSPLLTGTLTLVPTKCDGVDPIGVAAVTTTGGVGNVTYLWTNGETMPALINIPAGVYSVTATDSLGCKFSISGAVTSYSPFDSNPQTPNVFTPNKDANNNFFFPLVQLANMQIENYIDHYTFEVYNRWGTKVFETQEPSKGWDGNVISGALATEGVYYWLMNYNNKCSNNTDEFKGFVQLLR